MVARTQLKRSVVYYPPRPPCGGSFVLDESIDGVHERRDAEKEGKTDQFLELLQSLPTSPPFVAPNQAALEQILSQAN